jgi:hypothetical protein
MNHNQDSMAGASRAKPSPPRDLSDFYLRWPEFRPAILSLLASEKLTAQDEVIIGWLVDLADRVGARDIH